MNVPDGPLDIGRFPDFLIIGPQRTGTTWLHANLREHPEIFLSRPKEIFYFSRIKNRDDPKFESADLGWYLRFFSDPLWLYTYKQTMSLTRYRCPYRPRVRGEATASYAAIDRDVIEDIATLKPDIKVIMMVRNPIDRAWSHAKKDLSRNRFRPLDEVGDDEFQAFFRDPYQMQCARYAECLENWSACLPPESIMVGRFDDVATRPEEFLTDALRFIGVSSDPRFMPPAAREEINPTAAPTVPDRHRAFLEELLADELEAWRRQFA